MKKPYMLGFLTICLLLGASNAHAAQVLTPLEFWGFSTASDDDCLQDVANSGSIGSGWNLNSVSSTTNDLVNGGVLDITGASDNGEGYARNAEPASNILLSTLGAGFV